MSDSDTYAVFLDFDGTLVEIAPTPDAVRVDPNLGTALEKLRDRLGGALAIVTGRPVAVIDDFLAPAKFDVAGLHGAERRSGGETAGGQDDPALRAEVEGLKAKLGPLDKVLIEDKGASVAVHWRLANAQDAKDAEATVKAAAAHLGKTHRLQLGKAVGEIVPAGATKGQAIRTLCDSPPYAGRRAIFMGDDRTDESAFESVNADGGISVRVGEEETVAAHRLDSPGDVRALLSAWADGAPIDPDALPRA